MESFGHKMFISSQPVPLTGTGVLYPRVRDFSREKSETCILQCSDYSYWMLRPFCWETFAVYAGEEEDDSAVHHVFIIKIIWCIAELVILRENFEELVHHEENMKRQKLYF